MIRWLLLAAVAASPVPALAQTADGEGGTPPKRVRSITLTGAEKCPVATDPDEIIVCATLEEPFRIPKQFREKPPTVAQESWTRRAEMIDSEAKLSRPGSCSVVGSGGQSGCQRQFMDEMRARKQAEERDAAGVP